jgi:hypothetical protein
VQEFWRTKSESKPPRVEEAMTTKQKARVAAATVTLTKLGGRGVLIPGGLILTATHCIELDGQGRMALGDWFLESVLTKIGVTFRVSPWFADPLSDLAVLGGADK